MQFGVGGFPGSSAPTLSFSGYGSAREYGRLGR